MACAEKVVQTLLVFLHRQHPVEIAGAGNLQDLLRVLQHGIGKKGAVREYVGRRLHGRRRTSNAIEGGRGSLPQPLQVARCRLRVRYRRQQQSDTRRHALGNAIEQGQHRSGKLGHWRNYIARRHRARFHHARIESAHTPARRAVVARLDTRVIKIAFERIAINIKLAAGNS